MNNETELVFETELWAEDNIKCPKCGVEDGDSWEYSSNEGEERCNCGAKFKWEREISVTYNMELIDETATGATTKE